MTRKQCFITVVVAALFFAFIGGGVGSALGRFAPGYYRAIYSNGDSPDFNPIEVGLGLGVTQGLAGGALIGLLIFFAMGNKFPFPLYEFLKKRRKILVAVSLVALLLLGTAYWSLLQLGNALAAYAYTSYVASQYIPSI